MCIHKTLLHSSIFWFCMTVTTYGYTQTLPFAANPFTVYAIKADRIAENADQARKLALIEVQQQAFKKLLQRFTHKEVTSFPRLTPKNIEDLIFSLEILTEELSSVRYLATLNIHFHPEKVQQFFRTTSMTFFTPPAHPFLVIPVVRQQNQTLLWSTWTPWRQAWERYTSYGSFIPFFLPYGELKDIRLINATQALNEEKTVFSQLLKQYPTNTLLVATLNLTNPQTVTIAHYEYRNLIKRYSFPVEPENLDQVIENFLQALTHDWKEDILNGRRGTHQDTQNITTSLNDFQHWIQILRAFDNEQRILSYTVQSLSSKFATFALTYQGQLFYLQNGLFEFLELSLK